MGEGENKKQKLKEKMKESKAQQLSKHSISKKVTDTLRNKRISDKNLKCLKDTHIKEAKRDEKLKRILRKQEQSKLSDRQKVCEHDIEVFPLVAQRHFKYHKFLKPLGQNRMRRS